MYGWPTWKSILLQPIVAADPVIHVPNKSKYFAGKVLESIIPTTFAAKDNHTTNHLTTDATDANHEIDNGSYDEDEHNNTRAAPRRQPPAPRDNSIWLLLAKDATFWASHETGYVEQERQQQHSQQ